MIPKMNQFKLNFFTNLLILAVSSVIGFYLVPYYINNLGMAAYALIPMTTSMAGFVVLITDSINGSVQRYVSVRSSDGSGESADSTFNTALVGTSRIVLLMLVVCIAVAVLSSRFLLIRGINGESIGLVVLAVLGVSLVSSWSGIFHNLLFVKNRLDIINCIKLVQIIVQLILIVVLFSVYSKNLTSYVMSYGASVAVSVLLSVVLSLRVCPVRLSLVHYDSGLFREIIELGVWNIINSYGNLLFLNASLILSGFILNLTSSGEYSLVVKVVSIMISVNASISYAFSPLMYKAYADSNHMKLRSLSLCAIKVTGVSMSLVLSFICVFSPQLLTIWLGTDHSIICLPLMLMVTVLALSCTVAPTYCTSVMALRLKCPAIATFGFGVLNVLLSLLLVVVLNMGIMGLAVSWSVSMLLKNCVFNTIYHSQILFNNNRGIVPAQLVGVAAYVVLVLYFYAVDFCFTIPPSVPELVLVFAPALVVTLLAVERLVRPVELDVKI